MMFGDFASAAGRRIRWRSAGALALAFLRSGIVGPAGAADCTSDCYVDATSGDDAANHGTSAADAFQTIQKAIDTVTGGGNVHVAHGLYNPNYTQVTKSVVLLGAGAGVDPSMR